MERHAVKHEKKILPYREEIEFCDRMLETLDKQESEGVTDSLQSGNNDGGGN